MPYWTIEKEQERQRQEMQAKMLRQATGGSNVMMQDVPNQGMGPTMMQGMPNQGRIQGQLTAEQQAELNEQKPIRGMREIMSAKTTTLGTALAKTLAAGLSGHYGRKEQKEKKAKLGKAMQKEANAAQKALDRTESREDARDQIAQDRLKIAQEAATAAKETRRLDREFKEKELKQKAKIAQARLDAAANKEPTYTPTGTERKEYRQAHGLEKSFQSLDALTSKMTPKQIDGLAKPLADIPLGLAPGSVKRYLEENLVYTDPKQREYRVEVAKIESDFSRMMSGLAVSGYEMNDRLNWSPYAAGISQEDRQTRLDALQYQTRRSIGTYNEMYPDAALPNSWEEEQAPISLNDPATADAMYQEQMGGAAPTGGPIQSNAQTEAGNLAYLQQQQAQAQQEQPQKTGETAQNADGITLYKYSDGKWRDQ